MSCGLYLETKKCILCETCVNVCSYNALKCSSSNEYLTIHYYPENCVEDCYICINKCPTQALQKGNYSTTSWIIYYPVCGICGERGLPFVPVHADTNEILTPRGFCPSCRRKIGMEKFKNAVPTKKNLNF